MPQTLLKTPDDVKLEEESLIRWRYILRQLVSNVKGDLVLQQKCAASASIKQRIMPPFIIGRYYAQYCLLFNKIYEAYMENLQLQRDPYFQEIIAVVVKRIFELREELVKLIRNDYIFVDESCRFLKVTPFDIVLKTPYCMRKFRSEDTEILLQKLWAEETKRRDLKPRATKIIKKVVRRTIPTDFDDGSPMEVDEVIDEVVEEEEEPEVDKSSQKEIDQMERMEHIIRLQKHERYRQFQVIDMVKQSHAARARVEKKPEVAPMKIRNVAASYIINVYREYMRLKRKQRTDYNRDVLLGIVPDVFAPRLDIDAIDEERFEHKANKRKMIHDTYFVRDEAREKERLIVFKKDGMIDDVTEEIVEWFKYWLYDYGFFPSYPYVEEGGTLMVVTGVYPSVEEQEEIDKKTKKNKSKSKKEIVSMEFARQRRETLTIQNALKLKQEAEKEKENKLAQEAVLKDKEAKEAEQLFKRQCNPKDDPGYSMKMAEVDLIEPFIKYRQAWSAFDSISPKRMKEIVYGYLMPMLTEDLYMQLHFECRKYVDELMRLELKVLLHAHKKQYAQLNWVYPKFPPRKRPKRPKSPPPPMTIDDAILKKLEPLFDLGIVRKCKTKIKDIWGDLSFIAYDYNLRDPDASFPLPGYGDIRRRLFYSCVYGIGLQEGATRNKSVMLLGPKHHGKSFMVDAVAGELNAIKIDLSPEVFSGKTKKPGKMLAVAFAAAKIFQPCVIYCRDVERLFYKAVPKSERKLKPTAICKGLMKSLLKITDQEKIIFIGTCSDPRLAKRRLPKMFDEIIMVPRLDYCTAVQYLNYRFAKIASMPRDFCTSALANVLQGYSFGFLIQLFDEVMTNERIIDLHIKPLDLQEFQEVVIEKNVMALTKEDYKFYEEWRLKYSPLAKTREEFAAINAKRAAFFKKEGEREMKQQAAAEAAAAAAAGGT